MAKIQPELYTLTPRDAKKARVFFEKSLGSLGFSLKALPEIPAKIKRIALEREQCRGSKQFIQADSLRKEVDKLGYVIEDTSNGPVARPVSK